MKNKIEKQIDGLKDIILNNATAKNYSDLAELYIKQGDFYNAEDCYSKAVELEPNNPDLRTAFGKLYSYKRFYKTKKRAEQFLKAIDLYLEIVSTNPNDISLYLKLVELYSLMKDFDKVEEYYLKIINLEPNNAEYEQRLAIFYDNQGRTDKAIEHYLKALEIDPLRIKCVDRLVDIYSKEGNEEKLEECLLKVLEYHPKTSYHITLAELYKKQKKFKEAEEQYLKALEIDERNEHLHLDVAYFYCLIKQFEKAKEHFISYIELAADDTNLDQYEIELAYYRLGQIYEDENNYGLARKYYLKSSNCDTEDPMSTYRLAILDAKMGNIEESQTLFEEAAFYTDDFDMLDAIEDSKKKRKPKKTSGAYSFDYFLVGELYYYQKKYDLAINCFSMAIEKDDKDKFKADCYRYLGLIYEKQNEPDKAKECFEKSKKFEAEED